MTSFSSVATFFSKFSPTKKKTGSFSKPVLTVLPSKTIADLSAKFRFDAGVLKSTEMQSLDPTTLFYNLDKYGFEEESITLWQVVALSGNIDVVKKYFNETNANYSDNTSGETVAHLLASSANMAGLQYLQTLGVKIKELTSKTGNSIAFNAAASGDDEFIKQLKKMGVSFNKPNRYGDLPKFNYQSVKRFAFG